MDDRHCPVDVQFLWFPDWTKSGRPRASSKVEALFHRATRALCPRNFPKKTPSSSLEPQQAAAIWVRICCIDSKKVIGILATCFSIKLAKI